MNQQTISPYISVVFANRNDNYGGELSLRINRFIDYYEEFVTIDPDLFEFIICDWNPPQDKNLLRSEFDWHRLNNVTHLEVPASIHEQYAGDSGFPIMDYIARNAALRRSKGEFCLILNHDIYISKSIFKVLRKRNLDKVSFYRADRVDYDFTDSKTAETKNLEQLAIKNAFQINRKHQSNGLPITNAYNHTQGNKFFSQKENEDLIDEKENSIISLSANILRSKLISNNATTANATTESDLYQQFYLHTNAGGDFILAPRDAFFKIHGLIETSKFYMHLDAYGIFQLFSAGFTQRVFRYPHMVFHADHDRSGRIGRRECISDDEHVQNFAKILLNEQTYQFNDSNWGLAKYNITCKENSA